MPGKTSSPQGCSRVSELVDLAPPVAASVWAKLKAKAFIEEKRFWGLEERQEF